MGLIRLTTWFPILAIAGPLLVARSNPTPLYGGPNGPPDELALQECRGEAAKAEMSGTAPADVRAELA
jgi:hypothetical protein